MRVALAVNPTSGKGLGARCTGPVTAALRAAGLRVDDVSAADADATLLACRQAIADGVEALIVVGGDGMAHLGVNAVAGRNRNRERRRHRHVQRPRGGGR
jgi:diacylglycerol kinase (ATP)